MLINIRANTDVKSVLNAIIDVKEMRIPVLESRIILMLLILINRC